MQEREIMYYFEIVKKYKGFTLGPIKENLEKGKISAFVGPNGAGKTTLLHCLCGLRQCEEGKIIFPSLDKIAIVGIGNLPKLYSMKKIKGFFKNKIDNNEFERLLKIFEIKSNKVVKNFSAGQKMLCQWIIALSRKDVEAFVLDEPFVHIDINFKDIIFSLLLKKIKTMQIPCVISSHNLLGIDKIADKVTFMQKGKILGTVEKPDREVFWVIRDRVENEKGITLKNGKTLLPVKRADGVKGEVLDLHDVFKLINEEYYENKGN